MANKNAPFGARVVGKLGSGVANGGTTEYEIASGASGNIFSGDLVKMTNTGTILVAAAGDEALGVIEYVIKNQLISRHELEEIVAFEGVGEVSEEEMEEADEMDIEFVDEEENINESDWGWLEDTKEHANYNGHPQGIVKIYDHDEIDRFVDIIDNYNGFPSTCLLYTSDAADE